MTNERKKEILVLALDMIKRNSYHCICLSIKRYLSKYEYSELLFKECLVTQQIQCIFDLSRFRPSEKSGLELWFPQNEEGQAKRIKILEQLISEL